MTAIWNETVIDPAIRCVLRTPETTAQVLATLAREGGTDIPEGEAIAATQGFQDLWAQLSPAEQARIIQLIVRRVTVTQDGLVIDLRTEGITGVMRDLMTKPSLVATE